MGSLVNFSIPFRGLKSGTHQFDFQIDSTFFKHFKGAPIEEGEFEVSLLFDKRPDMFVLHFDIDGWMAAECDRCLVDIQLPVKDQQQLIIKFSEEVSEDPLVEHISKDTQQLNVAKYVYEFIILSMPITKVYDCENDEKPPCDEEMLTYLENKEGEQKEEEESNPLWEELKKFNNKN